MVQVIRLDPWDWECMIFYDADAGNADVILAQLRRVGCSGESLQRAKASLLDGLKDTGLTFSSYKDRASVMVLQQSSCPDQFFNTFDHEKGHLATHIADALGINYRSEEYQYLSGLIAQKMWPAAKRFLCGC